MFFANRSTWRKVTPVMLPPGRARLETKPLLTGSSPVIITMGIVFVAALAARIAGGDEATMTSTRSRTSSFARTAIRSCCPSAKPFRNSTLSPST